MFTFNFMKSSATFTEVKNHAETAEFAEAIRTWGTAADATGVRRELRDAVPHTPLPSALLCALKGARKRDRCPNYRMASAHSAVSV